MTETKQGESAVAPTEVATTASEPRAEDAATDTLLNQVDLSPAPRLEGILLGTLSRFDASGVPYVTIPNLSGEIAAQTTTVLDRDTEGRQVALMFVQGSAAQPIILGLIQNPSAHVKPREARVDGKKIVLEAADEIEFRCGKSSIKMTRDGKVIVKGTHLVSRSSGANKIKGASVLLN
ncbi:DUF6484 domain-containing protein [Sulfidibacter corallicola]|uniref:DUF6484 domain-containing protein n=1 Tax=Sulfidibacter corallicola TaxID=2818388 RepID=A0A8A4TWQ0_SULCO|nr:DUF6484 domain-containing protein [Sulfidibacter corallicola]QTD53913.1 hypothetical protein J3U87_15805 [Sulfidibacter corallicola]